MGLTSEKYAFYSGAGLFRSCIFVPLLQPLEVLKVQRQISDEKTLQIIRSIFRENGAAGFFKGLNYQLARSSIKQLWTCPMIMTLPGIFNASGFGPLQSEALTGIALAAADSICTPLEKMRLLSIAGSPQNFKSPWQGYQPYFLKLGAYWPLFLLSQKYFKQGHKKEQEAFTLAESALIGIKVSFAISILSAPLDLAHVLTQTQGSSAYKKPFHLKNFIVFSKKSFRGSLISGLAQSVHTTASVILISKLEEIN